MLGPLRGRGRKKEAGKRKTPAEEHRKGDDVLVVQGNVSRLLAQTRLTSRKIASFEVEQSLLLSLELAKVRFEVPCRLAPVSSSKTPAGVFASKMKNQIEQNIRKVRRSCPFSFPFLVFQKSVHRTCTRGTTCPALVRQTSNGKISFEV